MNTCLQAENSSLSSYMEDKVNEDVHFMKKKRYVKDSRLTEGAQLKPEQCPVVFSSGYDISCLGLERLHPFDARKWGNIHNRLIESGKLSSKASVIPKEASNHDLNVVHTEKYLHSLKNSVNVARIVEVPIVALIPHCFYDCKLLRPMRSFSTLKVKLETQHFRLQTGGTVLAAELALKNNWAINIGGGFHHASSSHGGGFCVYADISLALQFLFLKKMISRAMIVDLDAHQGNGHENDFRGDARVYIFDMFNCEIYPRDGKAEDGINRSVKLICGGQDEEYLRQLSSNLKAAFEEFTPDLVIYNAGTDCLVGDPLGLLNISADGILKRDEMVFVMSRERSIPIAMVTSGGYLRESAKIVADSILNLHEKELVQLK